MKEDSDSGEHYSDSDEIEESKAQERQAEDLKAKKLREKQKKIQ